MSSRPRNSKIQGRHLRNLLLCSSGLIGIGLIANPAAAQTSANNGHVSSTDTGSVTGDGATLGTSIVFSGAGGVFVDGASISNTTGTPNADALHLENAAGGGFGVSFLNHASTLTTTQSGGAAMYISQSGANLGISHNVSGNVFTGSYGERYVSSGAIFYERSGSGGSDTYVGNGTAVAGVHLTGNLIGADFSSPTISGFATGISLNSTNGAGVTTLGGTISTLANGTGISVAATNDGGGVSVSSGSAITTSGTGVGINATSNNAANTVTTIAGGTIDGGQTGIRVNAALAGQTTTVTIGAAIGATARPTNYGVEIVGTGVVGGTNIVNVNANVSSGANAYAIGSGWSNVDLVVNVASGVTVTNNGFFGTIASGRNLTVNNSGTITNTYANGSVLANSQGPSTITLNNSGSMTGGAYVVAAAATANVTNSGTLTAGTSSAILTQRGGTIVNNSGGVINGGSSTTLGWAIQFNSSASSPGQIVTNNATINGGGGGAIYIDAVTASALNLNSGSTTTGLIKILGSGTVTTTLAGTLAGGYDASTATGAQNFTLASTGSMQGATFGSAGDTFTFQGGTIGGVINAGSGTDTFNSVLGAGNSASASLSNLTGFENYNHQSGTLTLSGTRSTGPGWNVTSGASITLSGALTTTTGSGTALTINGNTSGTVVQILSGASIGGFNGLFFNGAPPATFSNAGSVSVSSVAVQTNGSTAITNTGTLASSGNAAIVTGFSVASLVNSGTVSGGAASFGISSQFSAMSITNQAGGFISGGTAAILGGRSGSGGVLTISNASGAGIAGSTAISTAGLAGIALTNSGQIVGSTNAINAGGTGAVTITNNAGGVIATGTLVSDGTFTAGGNGNAINLLSGTVTNSGIIDGAAGGAVATGALTLTNSGTITSHGTGTGNFDGVTVVGSATILNSGTITGGGYAAIYSAGGGTITNAAAGHLVGAGSAAMVLDGGGTFNNYGSATNAGGAGVAVGNGGATINLLAGSTTGSVTGGNGNDILAIYNGRGTAGTATVNAPSGITLQNAGTLAAASFGAVNLGGGTDTLQLRGTGDGSAANGTAGSLDLGGAVISTAEILTKADSGTWTLTGAAITPGMTINAGLGGAPGSGGLLIFSGSGLTGTINVNGATIRATSASAFGTGTINAIDPTIQFAATGTYANAISLASVNPSTDPTNLQTFGTGITATLSGAITQASAGQPLVFSSVDSSGTANAGTFILTNTANSWTGATTVSAGTTLQGATNTISGTSVANAGTLAFVQAIDGTFAANISGAGLVQVNAPAQVVTFSGTNTNSGLTSILAGTLVASGGSAIGDASTVNIASGAELQLANSETIGGLSGAGTARILANTLSLGGNNASTTFSGSISDQTPVAYVGSWNVIDGPAWSTNPPTYTGQEAAALLFGGSAANYRTSTAGAGTNTITDTAWYNRFGGNPNFVEAAANYRVDTGGAGYNAQQDSSAYVADHIGDTTRINYAFTGGVSLGGGLTKTGTGTLTLSGTNNYTGVTSITGGTLAVQNGAAIADTGAVSVGAAGLFSVLGSETIATLTGSGATTIAGGTNLTLANASGTYSGNITGGALTLAGGSWTYGGTRSGNDASAVTLSGAATTLNVAATGSIQGGQYLAVRVSGAGDSIANLGAITNVGTGGDSAYGAAIGVLAASGATTITNGSLANATATISGRNAAINHVGGSAGTLVVNNYAQINGDLYNAIENQSGSGALTVNNFAGGTINGHGNSGGGNGIANSSTAALTVANAGSIAGLTNGIVSSGTATITNSGSITGTNSYAIYLTGANSSVTNSGTITGLTGTGTFTPAVYLYAANGSVTNQAGGLITGRRGVELEAANGNVVNAGTITATYDNAITLFVGGSAVNQAGGVLNATQNAGAWGIYSTGAIATITNAGTINAGAGIVTNFAGTTVSNSGTINGQAQGVWAESGPTALTNSGAIGASAGYGVQMAGGGSVTNLSGGTIAGSVAAMSLTGTGYTIDLRAGSTVTGAIAAGTTTGTNSYAVAGTLNGALTAGTGADSVTLASTGTMTSANLGGGNDSFLYRGGSFSGLVDGGAGTDGFTSNLAGSATVNLANLAGFESYTHQAGTLTLTGTNGATGPMSVTGGTLVVAGNFQGATDVANGGTLRGTGNVGATTIANGGTLAGAQGGTLTMASLGLNSGSIVNATFSGAGGNALFATTGNLVLDGTLNVASTGAFGYGVYGLFSYGGALTDNGLNIGTVPGDAGRMIVQTSVAGKVNLVNAPTELLFWDGGNVALHDNNQVNGGSGTWSVTSQNWTDANGSFDYAMAPQPGFAVFQGAPGTVTVDNSAGAVSVTGMQFAVDGYRIEGAPITLANASTIVRVGDGTAPSAAYTATIAAVLTGAGGLTKSDLGTLILTGQNDYTGATTVSAGTLQGTTTSIIGANIVDNATLAYVQPASGTVGANISGSGVIAVSGLGAGNALTFSGALTNLGGIQILDASNLTLTGSLDNTSGNGPAISAALAGATVTNLGSILSNGNFPGTVAFGNGATVINGAVGNTTASIDGGYAAIYSSGGLLNVTNYGTITSGGYTIVAQGGNGASPSSLSLVNNGTITGALDGVVINETSTTSSILNSGTINGSSTAFTAIFIRSDGTITNSGSILGGSDSGQAGITSLSGNLTVTNQAAGLISGFDAIDSSGALTLTNSGTITGQSNAIVASGSADITNSGTITGTNSYALIANAGGSLTNLSGGTIGTSAGAISVDGAALFTADLQAGSTTTGQIQSTGSGARTVTVAGTLAGAYDASGGTGADTVMLQSTGTMTGASLGAGDDAFVYQGGSFSGLVDGGAGTDGFTSNLAGSASVNLATLAGFESYTHQAGALTLTGTNSDTGPMSVSGGTLIVDGNFQGATDVANGATLRGTGNVGATTIANGGTLAGAQGGTLTMASLGLNAGSTVNATFSGAGGNALFAVTGDLILDGTLNVASTGAFGYGVYGLFSYGGTLTDNGLAIGTTPADASRVVVQTSAAGQVNLLNAPNELLFWDGGDAALHNNNQVNGGSGTWSVTAENWTDATGAFDYTMAPQPGFAVFQGAPGTVTVDDSAGAVSVTGMQFAVDGYRIQGDAVTLALPATTIRVGDGTAPSAAYTATIASVLTGAGGLAKSDLGTLILTAQNDYSGGTSVDAGTLQVGDGNAAGGLLGNVTLTGDSTLDIRGQAGVTGNVLSTGGGTHNLVVAGTLGGAYDASSGNAADNVTLAATGIMQGANLGAGNDSFLYLGGTFGGTIDGGAGTDGFTSQLGNGAATLNLAGIANFETITHLSGTLTLTGASASPAASIFAGAGSPAGMLILNGTSGLTGDLYVDGAILRAGSAGAFGTGTIHMIDPSVQFGATGSYANAISLEVAAPASANPSTLAADAGVTATLTGAITQGSGGSIDANQPLVIAGAGAIVLTNAANTWTGTTTINAGATLQGASNTISGSSVVANGLLAFVQPASGTFGQDISGTGAVIVSGLGAGQALTFSGTSNVANGFTIADASTMVNSGTMTTSTQTTVTLAAGGTFDNEGIVNGAVANIGAAGATFVNAGAVNGIVAIGGTGLFTIHNQGGGSIVSSSSAVLSNPGGAILLDNAGDIAGAQFGVQSNNAGDAIDNSGRIIAGTITGPATYDATGYVAVRLQAGGTVNNLASGLIAGGTADGIYSNGLLNLTNAAGATITGNNAINAYGQSANIDNAGLIKANGTDYAIGLSNGATIANSGTITGGTDASSGYGINATGLLTFTNTAGGTIGGGAGAILAFNQANVDLQAGSTANGRIFLFGNEGNVVRIAGAFTGQLLAGNGDDSVTLVSGLTLGAGTTLNGGAGTDALFLTGAGNATLDSSGVSNFESRTMNGTGIWTLTGSDFQSSGWQINSGTLAASGGTAIGDNVAVNIAAGAHFQLLSTERVGSVTGLGNVDLGANTLTIGNGTSLYGGVIGGTGGLVIDNGAIVTLAGANTYTGATIISGGTLRLGASNVLSDATAVTAQFAGVLDMGAFDDTVAAATFFTGTRLDGTGTLTSTGGYVSLGATFNANLGAGTLDAQGGTTMLNGTAGSQLVRISGGAALQLGASNRFSDSATVSVAAGGVLDLRGFNDTVALLALNGTLLGSGTLTADQYQLTGAAVYGNLGTGTLFQLGGTSTLYGTAGAANVMINGGTLRLGAPARLADNATVTIASGATLDLATFNDTIGLAAINGTLAGSGTLTASEYDLNGALVNANLGAGTLFQLGGTSVLNGTAAASQVAIQAGTLTLGASNRLADNATVAVSPGATLNLGASNDTIGLLALNGTLNGTGTLTAAQYQLTDATVNGNLGAGTLFQLGGTSVLNGKAAAANVMVNAGTLRLGASDRLADNANVAIASGATLDLASFSDTVSLATINGTLAGTGTLTAAQYQLTGATVNANLGAGALFQLGGSSLLNGTAAATQVAIQAGTLTLGASNRLADNANVFVVSGATLNLAGFSDTVGMLALNGTLAGTGTMTAAQYQLTGATVNGNLGTGTLFQLGGISVLNGTAAAANVMVNGGTLRLGASDRLADNAMVAIASGATLDLAAFSDTVGIAAINGRLAGTGTLTAGEYDLDGALVNANLGTGTLFQLGGTSVLNGTAAATQVAIQGGTLTLGAANRLADNATVTVSSGASLNLAAFDETVGLLALNGTLDGTGTLTAAQYQLNGATVNANLGAGALFQLGGSSLLNGTAAATQVAIQGGTLTLGAANRLADNATVTVSSGATLNLAAFNETVGLFALNGTLDGTGTLTADQYQLNGATVNANLGAGPLFQLGGASLLNGTAASAQIAIQAGTLTLGASNRLADNATLSVSPGATLDLAANSDTIGILALAGTLDGTGTLTAAQYQLTGATVNANLGAGTLFQLAGTSVLNGTAASDPVLVQGGTLRLGAANRLGDGADVTIWSGATLNLASFSDTVDVVAVGGTLAGTGTLTGSQYQLTGAAVNANLGTGTLFQLGGTSVLNGTAAVSAVQIQSGTLRLGASNRIADTATLAIDSAGTLDLAGFEETVASAAIAGTLNGTGTLTAAQYALQGATINANLGTGAIFNVSGTSILNGRSSAATLGIIAGTLRLGAAERLDNRTDVTINAGGVLDLAGFEETIDSLDGNGSVTLGAGRLHVGADNGSSTFAGVISGSGSLEKIGSGLFIYGNNQLYTGGTTVTAGELRLLGTTAGAVNVNGGTFSGNGTINGRLTLAGGTISPGVGTISGFQATTFNSTAGIFAVDVNLSQADFLQITGAATLSGGLVQTNLQAAASQFQFRQLYTILQAGSLTGTFANPAGFVSAGTGTDLFQRLRYDILANSVVLEIRRMENFAAAAGSPNQSAVGDALNSTRLGASDSFATLLNEFGRLTPAQQATALDALGNEGAGNASLIVGFAADRFAELIDNRLDGTDRSLGLNNDPSFGAQAMGVDRRMATIGGAMALAGNGSGAGSGAWMKAYGFNTRLDGSGTTADLRANGRGVSMGYDVQLGNVLIGGAGGFVDFHGTTAARATDTSGTAWQGALYARYRNGGTFAGVAGTYVHADLTTIRSVQVGALGAAARGDTDARVLTAEATAGHDFQVSRSAQFGLIGTVRFSDIDQDAYGETGGSVFNLNHDAQSRRYVIGTAMARAGNDFAIGTGMRLNANVRAGVSFAQGDLDTALRSTFAGAPAGTGSFSTTGAALPSSWGVIGAGLNLIPENSRWEISLRYEGRYGSRLQENQATVGVGIRW